MFNNKSLIKVTGVIAWIDYPVDGHYKSKCIVNLETNDSSVKEREGNYICCEMNEKISEDLLGREVTIAGKYGDFYKNARNSFCKLKKCEMVLSTEFE